jgi:glycosyltransferase involved in cell wall biosynthesis
MKIAQIASLAEAYPPDSMAAPSEWSRILQRSWSGAGTKSPCSPPPTPRPLPGSSPAPRAPCLDPAVRDPFPHLVLQLERVRQRAHEFDVLHFHIEPPLHFPLFRALHARTLTTLHGRLDVPDLQPLLREFREMPLVSISDSQRRARPDLNWVATVHHGLGRQVCPFNPMPRGGYFAFLGRVSPEKGLARTIAIARRTGVRLRIAAKVDQADERYFREVIAPQLGGDIEFVGEVDEAEKPAFLGHALGLLFPID